MPSNLINPKEVRGTKKKRAKDQTDYRKMYLYFTDMCKDLHDAVDEYLGEVEHSGEILPVRVDADTVDDVEKWIETRKKLLIKDFIGYWSVALED